MLNLHKTHNCDRSCARQLLQPNRSLARDFHFTFVSRCMRDCDLCVSSLARMLIFLVFLIASSFSSCKNTTQTFRRSKNVFRPRWWSRKFPPRTFFIFKYIFLYLCVSISNFEVQSGTETMNQIFNWKKLSFFSVNLFKNLHASTYTILLYIYKVKKIAANGNPDL